MVCAIPCPTCGEQVPLAGSDRPQEAPFCSQRCRLIDLGNWAEGRYGVSRPLSYDDFDSLASAPGVADADDEGER